MPSLAKKYGILFTLECDSDIEALTKNTVVVIDVKNICLKYIPNVDQRKQNDDTDVEEVKMSIIFIFSYFKQNVILCLVYDIRSAHMINMI